MALSSMLLDWFGGITHDSPPDAYLTLVALSRYDLGSTRYRVLLIGFLYFIASGVQSTFDVLGREGDLSPFAAFVSAMVVFPVVILDTLFYWWIFLSLMKTIQQLQARQARFEQPPPPSSATD
jgi:hypothetical protein